MSKPYTDEEYHAAWHAAYGSDTIGDRQVFPVEFRDIRDALDAVAPAIIRRAKAEALREEADRTYAHTVIGQRDQRTESQRPLYSADVRKELHARADEIEVNA